MRNTDEFIALQQEYKKLSVENKKLARSLNLAQKQIERNRVAFEAKDNLSRVISAKRSELERYMNLLLGNCPDRILLFDQEEKIAYCTESFLKLCRIQGFGIIRGAPWKELLTPYMAPEVLAHLENALARIYSEKQTVEFAATVDFSREGALRNYTVQVTPMLGAPMLGVDGHAEGFMIIFSDTTEIVHAQQEAERANAAKSDFLATISHEIRTPMNAIIGVAGMLKSSGLDETQHEYLRNIQNSSHVLLNLINDILDFSKMEAGKLELIPEYFRLYDLLGHLRTMFELLFHQKGLAFICDFAQDLPEVVCGDDQRIRQILTNILNNALKYTKQGSVRFHVHRRPGGPILFEIADTGIGIQKEALPRLFSAFEQLDLARNKGVMGTGLGLVITKRLCALMDGSIEVESEYGKGSVFTVALPLQEGTPADLPPEERKEAYNFTAPEVKALIVDDIEINLQIAAYMLEMFEITADLALSGQASIDMVARNTYDIIFMDHMMPGMDGIEATRTIRSIAGYPAKVPIVALTANAVTGAMENFLANGFNDFLSKPMDDMALAYCLLKWIPKEKIQYLPEAAPQQT